MLYPEKSKSVIFRDSIFAIGEYGIGVGTRDEKIAPLFPSPHGLSANRIPPTITLEEIRLYQEDSKLGNKT